MELFVLLVFLAVYIGMALGRWPGLRIDRTGIALIGALALVLGGALEGARALAAVDFPTIFILFGLMILSAQFAACGFYDWAASRLAAARCGPLPLLLLVTGTAGVLSAVLANDVVVFAMAPLLVSGLLGRGLDPRPFIIALAGGANAGSAATIIGNPQNVLIGQAGALDFWRFLALAGPPALLGLAAVFLAVAWRWRGRFWLARRSLPPRAAPLDRAGLGKGVAATFLLLLLFAVPLLPQASSVLLVAGFLLISRRLATRRMLGLVDWHLLVLFAALFVVTGAFAESGLPAVLLERLGLSGSDLARAGPLAALSVLGSNSIGNVPLVMLLLAALPDLSQEALTALAVFTTLAGNLFLVGSFANLIAVERAAEAGVELSFLEHARAGVPMTLLSLACAASWFVALGVIDL